MYQLDRQIVMQPVAALRESPRQRAFHPDFDPSGKDAWFVDDIRTHGILVPLLVKPDQTVKEGHRRLWTAKLLGIREVPTIQVSGDDDAIMCSAILHRTLSLYTKCIAYRDRLEPLIDAGASRKLANLKSPAAPAAFVPLDDEWERVEQILQVTRRNLADGVRLLRRLEDMEAKGSAGERDKAMKARERFRNHGLRPALRFLDERSADEVAAEPAAEDELPAEPAESEPLDCKDWSGGSTPAPKPTTKPAAKPAAKTTTKDKPAAKPARAFNPYTPGKSTLTQIFNLVKQLDAWRQGAELDRAEVERLRFEPAVAEWIDRMYKLNPTGRDDGTSKPETNASENTGTAAISDRNRSAGEVAAVVPAQDKPQRKAKGKAQAKPSRRARDTRLSTAKVAGGK